MRLNYWLTSLAWRISLLFALLAFLALFGRQALPAFAEAPAYVRLIQASPDVGTADVFVDGSKFLSSFVFATVTDYRQLPAGPHKVQIALIGKGPGATAIAYTLAVKAGLAYTVAAIGTKATGLALESFVDDNRLASDRAKLRVYNLAPGIGVVSVASGGKPLLSGLAYAYASDYLTLPAGSYTFNATAPQPTTTIAVSAALKPNTVTCLFALSTASLKPQLQFVSAQVKGVPALSGTGSDPYARIAPSQPLPLLLPGMVGVVALGGASAGLAVRRLLAARQPKRASLTSNGTPCRRCSKSEERLHATRRGQWVVSKNLFALCLLGLLLSGLALLAPLALAGCGQQSSSSHKASPIHSSTGRLLIPAIGVNAAIEPSGVLPDGTLATPTQDPWNDVGWYNSGPRPGEQGSAVINGHLNRPGGSPAVFWHLNELHLGDKVIVVDTQGKRLHFHVTGIRLYAQQEAPVQDIFGNTAGRFLNLMTCAGGWIPSEHQTSLRLVVYTSLD
jgi:sortase (surface protein transpeptidase)